MKKIIQLLAVVFVMVLSSPMALAYNELEEVHAGKEVAGLKRIAIGAPYYTERHDGPAWVEVASAVSDAAVSSRLNIMSYDSFARRLREDVSIDIRALKRRDGEKVYKENIGKYADCYAVLTVANNARLTMFFDVYKAGSNELLYNYRIVAGKDDPDTAATYTMLTQRFYKALDRNIENQKKAIFKAERKAGAPEVKAAPLDKEAAKAAKKKEREDKARMKAEEARINAAAKADKKAAKAAKAEAVKKEAKKEVKPEKKDKQAKKEAKQAKKEAKQAKKSK